MTNVFGFAPVENINSLAFVNTEEKYTVSPVPTTTPKFALKVIKPVKSFTLTVPILLLNADVPAIIPTLIFAAAAAEIVI